MVQLSMTLKLNDLWPRCQLVHDIFDIEYLRNDTRQSHIKKNANRKSYAFALSNDDISNDLDGPQGHGIFEVEYLKNGTFYGQSY